MVTQRPCRACLQSRHARSAQMLGLPDEPLSMAWYGDNLFVGYRREYNIIDGDGSVETIRVSIDSRTTPLIKFMPNKELLLAGEQQLGIYINLKGQPANRGTVFWSRPPSTVGACLEPRSCSVDAAGLMPLCCTSQRTASPTS